MLSLSLCNSLSIEVRVRVLLRLLFRIKMTIIFFNDKQGKVLIFEQCCWEIYISVLKAFFFLFFFFGFCYRFDINMLF